MATSLLPTWCSLPPKFEGEGVRGRCEKGVPEEEPSLRHTRQLQPQREGPVSGHGPWVLGTDKQLDQGRDETYLHSDALCQGCPGPQEAQCGEQEGVHGSSALERGVAGSGCHSKNSGTFIDGMVTE